MRSAVLLNSASFGFQCTDYANLTGEVSKAASEAFSELGVATPTAASSSRTSLMTLTSPKISEICSKLFPLVSGYVKKKTKAQRPLVMQKSM